MAFDYGKRPQTNAELIERILRKQEQHDTDIKRLWGIAGTINPRPNTWQTGNLESASSSS